MNQDFEKVCVVGLGYIGLPTASLLATKGFSVVGVDVSEEVVNTINQGGIHIVEPDLDILVKSAVNSGNLTADTKPTEADVFIIAVPTPLKNTILICPTSKARLSHISPYVRPGNLIILESTSPVGTTEEIVARGLRDRGHDTNSSMLVAHCPERVLPGRILIELIENDRIVGGINDQSTAAAAAFYEKFVRGKVLSTNARTAELVKLTENSYRDVNIAFANEISMICETEGINTWELIELANKHPRVNILNPGPGVGGHCIAVDPWFIVHRQPKLAKLIHTARDVNDAKPDWVIDRVRKCAAKFKHPVIGCLGLSFKADVDDLRESPALDIVNRIVEEDIGDVLVCEPNLDKHESLALGSLEEVIAKADIVLILVDHEPFNKLTAASLKEKVVIDTRGIIR